ncbi:hypothetical protein ABEB36_014296 [Hypothenemus hampei]|uniref:Transposable element Tcb2 transposase n=1 Tax=Hypothenemus hampei TaxID=57062 RepID=A0ABD1E6R0_HYPHA
MPGRAISLVNRGRIIALHDEGLSNHQISDRLDIPRSSVIRIVNLYRTTGGVDRRFSTGRRRVTNEREDRYISNFVRRNPTISITALRGHFLRTYQRPIASTTIRRRLYSANLRSRRVLRVPRLLPRHIAVRFLWAQEHRNWLLPQWQNVLFTDETRVGLVSDSRRLRVWRAPGRQERLTLPREVLPYQGGTIMFWGGIMFNHRTQLIPIAQTMTGEIYAENIVRAIIYPLRNEIGENFIFMDDNARPHRTRGVEQALADGNIRRLNWPAYSPDMNPIEHVWDYIKRRIHQRNNPPMTLNELTFAVQDEWDNMPQETINNLIVSMSRRVRTLLNNRGRHTEY